MDSGEETDLWLMRAHKAPKPRGLHRAYFKAMLSLLTELAGQSLHWLPVPTPKSQQNKPRSAKGLFTLTKSEGH